MRKSPGFTILEMSIVLTIIGFIISGMVYSSAIIKQASIRAVITEVRSLSTAINNFKLIYGTIPGDLATATSYWTPKGGTQTASLSNGNGNGIIDNTEYHTALQMLSSAGLTQSSLNYQTSMPSRSSINSSYLIYNHNINSKQIYGNTSLGNVLDLGLINSIASAPPSFVGSIKPQDAFDIDVKMDDGLYYTGIVNAGPIVSSTTANTCTVGGTSILSGTSITSADSYYIWDKNNSCFMVFWIIDAVN